MVSANAMTTNCRFATSLLREITLYNVYMYIGMFICVHVYMYITLHISYLQATFRLPSHQHSYRALGLVSSNNWQSPGHTGMRISLCKYGVNKARSCAKVVGIFTSCSGGRNRPTVDMMLVRLLVTLSWELLSST